MKTDEAIEVRQPTPDEQFLQLIERVVSSPDVDAEKVRAFLDMQILVQDRRAKAAFDAAFAQMQSAMPEIDERGQIKVNNVVRSTYAKFEDINRIIKPILKEHGFALMFKTASAKGEVTVTGVLTHEAGHREETSLTLEADTSGSKNGVQSIGSSTQYGKRYVTTAILNITTRGEDDDGAKGNVKRIDEKQIAELRALAEEVGADIPKFCTYMKIDKLDNLPASMYGDAVKAFEKKRKAA